jgi:PEGA domain
MARDLVDLCIIRLRMSLARIAASVLLVMIALSAPAHAGQIALIVTGEPAKQPVIETTLSPWLVARGFEVQIGVKDTTVSDKLLDCFILTDQSCAEAAVKRLKIDNTLFVMVSVEHDTVTQTDEVSVTGWLYGAGGTAIAAQSVFCRACKNDTLTPTVIDLADALFAVEGQGMGRIKITSKPLGARVLLDGAVVGATPWEQGLRAGPHTVTIEQSGYQTATVPVEVKKGVTAPVDVALTGAAGSHPGGVKRNPMWLGVAGAGVVAAVAGVVLIAKDEDAGSVSTLQRTYFDSAAGGYALVGAGVLAIGVGAALYVVTGKPSTATTATAWIDPTRGAGLGLSGRF